MGFDALVSQMDGTGLVLLGEPVTYTPTVGSPVTVQGQFDAAYVRVEAGKAGVSSVGPAVGLRLSDLPSDPNVDTTALVTIEGTTYQLREANPDGKGFVVLLLHLHA